MVPSARRRTLAGLALALLLPLVAGCTSTVSLTPAARANTVGCAGVVVRLPSSLEGLSARSTNAQGTAAWGSPASVLMTCGITTPKVSDLACYTVGGVDWLVTQTGAGDKDAVYTTYGRSPGVQVVVDTKAVPTASNVLFDVASAVKTLPKTGSCQSALSK
ncbi:DUF3515 family protein [Frondihabitans australicus]|uniref:Uncharacterized protein DUF3515 n=1 Tax=Frondihabitans australicus TaxID=386892 RepID=A0A495IDT0_9MICO|nr:DUF3515 family protein [Frondihabitans australicus]RKR73648.1 uncharacterized protein DUF3515 [Frondihabitans australicus]